MNRIWVFVILGVIIIRAIPLSNGGHISIFISAMIMLLLLGVFMGIGKLIDLLKPNKKM